MPSWYKIWKHLLVSERVHASTSKRSRCLPASAESKFIASTWRGNKQGRIYIATRELQNLSQPCWALNPTTCKAEPYHELCHPQLAKTAALHIKQNLNQERHVIQELLNYMAPNHLTKILVFQLGSDDMWNFIKSKCLMNGLFRFRWHQSRNRS